MYLKKAKLLELIGRSDEDIKLAISLMRHQKYCWPKIIDIINEHSNRIIQYTTINIFEIYQKYEKYPYYVPGSIVQIYKKDYPITSTHT